MMLMRAWRSWDGYSVDRPFWPWLTTIARRICIDRQRHASTVNATVEREMFHRRIEDTWFGQKMWIATAEDIVLHKLHWNRISPSERQRADIGGVIAVQKGKLDEGYLRRWASEMGLSKELEDALSGKFKLKQT